MSQRSDIEKIKARLNLVDITKRYMELRRVGGRFTAPCPFHNETKPSFSINEEEGLFYCFGCQASGDLIDFYSRINGLDFREALVQLAEEAGVELTRGNVTSAKSEAEADFKRRAMKMHDLALRHFVANLHSGAGEGCRAYLQQRKISQEMIEAFELGYSLDSWQGLANALQGMGLKQEEGVRGGLLASSEKGGRIYDRFRARLMFPIKNLSGRVVAFGGRIIPGAAPEQEEQAKYINSSDSPIYKKGEHLYGLFQARRFISHSRSALLTEGYLDVISLHQHGFNNACGVLGTALTKEQVKRLAGFCSKIELIFDGDAPGRKAALRSAEMILATGLNCKVVLLPEGEDIDSLLQNSGPQAFENLRRQAKDGLDYCVLALKSDYAPRETVEWVKNFAAQVEQPELLSGYLSRLSAPLGLDESLLREEVKSRIKKGGSHASFFGQPDSGLPNGKLPQSAESIQGRAFKASRAEELLSRQLLHFMACFPGYAKQLRELGCDKILTTPFSRALWEKLCARGEEEAFEYFTEEEKSFWSHCRVAEPLPAANREELLEDIKLRLQEMSKKDIAKTYKEVLRQLRTDNDPGLEILRALTETQRNSNG